MYHELKETKLHGTSEYPYAQYHIVKDAGYYHFPVHWHEEIELLYVKSGMLTVCVSDVKYNCGTNTLCLVNPKELHYMETNGDEVDYYAILFPIEFIAFQADDALEKEIFLPLKNGTMTFRSLIERTKFTMDFKMEFDKIIELNMLKPAFYELDTRIYLLQIFRKLLALPDSFCSNVKNSDFSREMLTYIREHFEEKLTLPDIAAYFHMSAKYLSRYFKQHFNINFSDYVNKLRLSKAKKLLDTTDYSITEISLMCGYPSISYFIRSFRNAYGSTPLSYRKK